MRKLEELKAISFYDLTANEIEYLRSAAPGVYKEKTEAIDTEAAAKPTDKTKMFVNGVEVESESISFTNGRRN